MSDDFAPHTSPGCPAPTPPAAALPRFHHRFDVCCPMPGLNLRALLSLTADWTILFGPSGSGKSSLLRAACGLLHRKGMVISRREAGGAITILQDAAVYSAPHLRGFRWAAQHDALFPHLTVRENIAFAAQAIGLQAARKDDIASATNLFRLAPLLDRRPATLSGGERRRVSMARAFAAPGCRLLMLDEPFNGIDHALRDVLLPAMRLWLRERGIPVLSVTHSVEEALQLDAHVAVLEAGRITHEGSAPQALAAERSRLLARLA